MVQVVPQMAGAAAALEDAWIWPFTVVYWKQARCMVCTPVWPAAPHVRLHGLQSRSSQTVVEHGGFAGQGEVLVPQDCPPEPLQ